MKDHVIDKIWVCWLSDIPEYVLDGWFCWPGSSLVHFSWAHPCISGRSLDGLLVALARTVLAASCGLSWSSLAQPYFHGRSGGLRDSNVQKHPWRPTCGAGTVSLLPCSIHHSESHRQPRSEARGGYIPSLNRRREATKSYCNERSGEVDN